MNDRYTYCIVIHNANLPGQYYALKLLHNNTVVKVHTSNKLSYINKLIDLWIKYH